MRGQHRRLGPDGALLARRGVRSYYFDMGVTAHPPETDRAAAARAAYDEGLRHLTAGAKDDAFSRFVDALRLWPDFVECLNALGNLLDANGRRPAALAALRRAAELAPHDGAIWNNLGFALAKARLYAEAEMCLRRAAELLPEAPQPHHHLASVCANVGRVTEALRCFDTALRLAPGNPHIRFDRGLVLLTAGEYPAGWEDYEARLELKPKHRDLPLPLWRGENVAGKTVVVYHDQGFGDTIMFAQLLPLLAARGASTVFRVPADLLDLMRTMPGAWRTDDDKSPPPPADLQCPIGSLPYCLELAIRDLPQRPYVSAPPGTRVRVPDSGKLKVGLTWSASVVSGNTKRRSVPLEDLLSICGTARADFASLQIGPRAADIADCAAQALVADLSGIIKSFADTAAFVGQLDLVVTVDTSVAHVAGAMGKPTFVLLPFDADWRWMRDRSDSPWYPSMRLFRQKRAGDWSDPLREAREALAAMV